MTLALIRILRPIGRPSRLADRRAAEVGELPAHWRRRDRPTHNSAPPDRVDTNAMRVRIRRQLRRVVPLIGRAHGRTKGRREIAFEIETLGDRRFPQVDLVGPALVGDAAAAREPPTGCFSFAAPPTTSCGVAAVSRHAPDGVAAGAIGGVERASGRRRSSRRRSRPGCPTSRESGVPPPNGMMCRSAVAPLMPRTKAMRVPSGDTDGE